MICTALFTVQYILQILVYYIDYSKAMFMGILYRISGSTTFLCKIANACATAIYKVSISVKHTIWRIAFGYVNHFVSSIFNLLIDLSICIFPSAGLVLTWQD